MGNGSRQGWHADPFRLHEARYFSAGTPTKLVRDGGVESYDEPPPGAWEPADITPGVTAGVTPGVTAGVTPGVTAGVTPVATAGVTPVATAVAPRITAPADPGFARPRRWSVPGMFSAAVLIMAAAALAAVAIMTGSRPAPPAAAPAAPGAGVSPVAFVTQSVRQTLGQRTADVTVSGSVQARGVSSPVHGSGEVNFSTNAMASDVTYRLPGSSPAKTETESEVEAGGAVYIKVSINGKADAMPGGRTWVGLPVKQTPPVPNITGSDPLGALKLLAAQGNTVTALGTRLIGGVTCSGYAIRPRLLPIFTLTVWIDSQRLVRELGAGMQMSFDGDAASVNLVMDFTNFGAPVRISPPPPSRVISLQALLKGMGLGSLASLPALTGAAARG
jgi:hypothetical protein